MLLISGYLKDGLTLFGDNAYVNTIFVTTPYKTVSGGPLDTFDCYNSNIRITIKVAFGMLIHKWGCLRKPIPCKIRLSGICALERCLCILQNFYINERHSNGNVFESECNDILRIDALYIVLNGGYAAERLNSNNSNYNNVSDRLYSRFDIGHHSNDLSTTINNFVLQKNNVSIGKLLPHVEMLEKLEIGGLVNHPKPRGSNSTNISVMG